MFMSGVPVFSGLPRIFFSLKVWMIFKKKLLRVISCFDSQVEVLGDGTGQTDSLGSKSDNSGEYTIMSVLCQPSCWTIDKAQHRHMLGCRFVSLALFCSIEFILGYRCNNGTFSKVFVGGGGVG